VVALTAFAMKDDRERLLLAGFDGYLEKPLDVRGFPGQIAALLVDAEART
jgi:two-component system cell cycle response regulator DivK